MTVFLRVVSCLVLSVNVRLLRTIDKVRRSAFVLVAAALISPPADYCRVVASDPPSCSINSPIAGRLFHSSVASHRRTQVPPPWKPDAAVSPTSAGAQYASLVPARLNCWSNWMLSNASPSICSAVHYKRRRSQVQTLYTSFTRSCRNDGGFMGGRSICCVWTGKQFFPEIQVVAIASLHSTLLRLAWQQFWSYLGRCVSSRTRLRHPNVFQLILSCIVSSAELMVAFSFSQSHSITSSQSEISWTDGY